MQEMNDKHDHVAADHAKVSRHRTGHHRSAAEAEEEAKAKRAMAIRHLHQHLTEKTPRHRRPIVLGDDEAACSGGGSSDSGGDDEDDDNNYYYDDVARKSNTAAEKDDDETVSVLSMFTKKYEDVVGADSYDLEQDSDSDDPTFRRPPRRISVITKPKGINNMKNSTGREDDGLSDDTEEDGEDYAHGPRHQQRQQHNVSGFLKLAHEDDPRQGSAGSLSYDEIIGNEQMSVVYDGVVVTEQQTPNVIVDFPAKAVGHTYRRRRRRSYQEGDSDEDENENEEEYSRDTAKELEELEDELVLLRERDTAKELEELEDELVLLREKRKRRSGVKHLADANAEEKKGGDEHQQVEQPAAAMKWESTRGQSGLARRRATRRGSRFSRGSSNEGSDILNAALHDSTVSAGTNSDFMESGNVSHSSNLSTGEFSGDISAGLEELRRRMAAANIKMKQDPALASASEVDQSGSSTVDAMLERRGSITRRGRRRGSAILRRFSSGLEAERSGDEMDGPSTNGPVGGRISKKLMDSVRSMDSVEEDGGLEAHSVGEIMEDFPPACYEVYDLKGSSDDDGPRREPRRSSRRKSSLLESDDESVNSRSSMASNAFSAVLSLAEELMVNPDDATGGSGDIAMPHRTQPRRNRSVASASSLDPDIVDKKHPKRRPSFDAGALGDLLVGKSNYLKTVETEEEALRGGLGQEEFHASMLLWDANKSSKPNTSNQVKEGQDTGQDHHFTELLNDCIPEMDEEEPLNEAQAKYVNAFPTKRRKSRRRKSRDSANSVGSLNTAESLEFSELAEKSMETDEFDEATADAVGGPRKSILRHVSSLSLESLDVEAKIIELELNESVFDEATSKVEGAVHRHRSAQPRSSVSSIPSVVLDALGDELKADAKADAEGVTKDEQENSEKRRSSRAPPRSSISSIPSVVLDALEKEVGGDADLAAEAKNEMTASSDLYQSTPSSRTRAQPRPSSFAIMPSVVLDALQSELTAEGDIDSPSAPMETESGAVKRHTCISRRSSLCEGQCSDLPEGSRQASEKSSPEVEVEGKMKRQTSSKGSLNALLGMLPNNLEDELDEETDGISPSNPQGGREIRKALSFDKLKAIMNDSLTKVDSGGNASEDKNDSFHRPGSMRQRSSSFGMLKDIIGDFNDFVHDDGPAAIKGATAPAQNGGVLACMDSTRAFDYNHEASIMEAMGREAPAHYNVRAAAAEEEDRRKRLSAGKAGFGGIFRNMLDNLGNEEAE